MAVSDRQSLNYFRIPSNTTHELDVLHVATAQY